MFEEVVAMEDIKWKSDKELDDLKRQMRKEVIEEITACCECRHCKKFKNYLRKTGG